MNDKTRPLTPEEARFKAFEGREWANRARNARHRSMLLQIAEMWERIAADVEQDG